MAQIHLHGTRNRKFERQNETVFTFLQRFFTVFFNIHYQFLNTLISICDDEMKRKFVKRRLWTSLPLGFNRTLGYWKNQGGPLDNVSYKTEAKRRNTRKRKSYEKIGSRN